MKGSGIANSFETSFRIHTFSTCTEIMQSLAFCLHLPVTRVAQFLKVNRKFIFAGKLPVCANRYRLVLPQNTLMSLEKDRKAPSDEELRKKLSSFEYHVLREGGTERAFTGEYWDCHKKGIYECRACGNPLFHSDTKYDSGSGWPSFFAPIEKDAVTTRTDTSHGMVRTEALCSVVSGVFKKYICL